MKAVLAGSLQALLRAVWWLVITWSLTGSVLQLREPTQLVRAYTRGVEFDFATWTINALAVKFGQFSLASSGYLPREARQNAVLEYFDLVRQSDGLQARLNEIYSDPSIGDPDTKAAPLSAELAAVRSRQDELQPLVEAVLQEQVAVVLGDLGLDLGGAPFPPVAFHVSRLPLALIVSPREVIRQEAQISLKHGLRVEEQVEIEDRVARGRDVSTLVVPVGGLGSYPTMIQQSASIVWVTEVIVHEWIHNYLTLRPLGLRYSESDDLRTMNETAASLLGVEIGRLVLERYYPEFAPPPPRPPEEDPQPSEPPPDEPPGFDFRREMRDTRVQVDALLAEGKVEQAEAYMEARRAVFWENGFPIRRLNQAYFAFYGAYADEPGGAAGEDPVGAAVRELWARIQDPAEFLRTMAWMSDFGDLQRALARPVTTP